ncbi:MAG: hypothetical protein PHW13_09470 [Methylococcales bacterium]|nr:hypothetical protein [Methylococcales bacterium]
MTKNKRFRNIFQQLGFTYAVPADKTIYFFIGFKFYVKIEAYIHLFRSE